MNCPIFYFAFPRLGKDIDAINMKCLEGECAWWSDSCKMCSIKALSSDIGFIAGTLANVETKMPHEKQFRT